MAISSSRVGVPNTWPASLVDEAPLWVVPLRGRAGRVGLDDFNQLIHPAFSRENRVSQNEFSLGAPSACGPAGITGIAIFHEFL